MVAFTVTTLQVCRRIFFEPPCGYTNTNTIGRRTAAAPGADPFFFSPAVVRIRRQTGPDACEADAAATAEHLRRLVLITGPLSEDFFIFYFI